MEVETGRVRTPYEGSGGRIWDPNADIAAPLTVHRTPVRAEWVDYNAHMSESSYLLVIGDNSDAFFRYLGIGEEYRATGHSLFTVETHLCNLREVAQDEPIELSLQLLDHDAKRLHVFHVMRHGRTGKTLATAEQLILHVDTDAGRATPMPTYLRERVAAIAEAHAALATPEAVGRPMGIRHR